MRRARRAELPGLTLRGAFGLGLASLCACVEPTSSCEEDPRAQRLDERVWLEIDGELREAELATDETARARGWRYRRCDRVALWLVPDREGEPLPVWGCGLVDPIDVAFVRDGEIVEVVAELAPCGGPSGCEGCRSEGEGLAVSGVLELPAGELELGVGMSVREAPAG